MLDLPVTLFYRFVRRLCRTALGIYFTGLEVHGRNRVPTEGPLLVLANHHNGMVDPLILIASLPRQVRFIAKAPLFRIPGLAFFLKRLKTVPVHRSQDAGYAKEKNEQVYGAVGSALAEGGAIGLFPEGKSHTDPALAEFKHGASKMALEAEAAAGFKLGLRIQLAGIHFERTRLFRGEVLVNYGAPLAIDSFREAHAADPKAAVEALTKALHERLSTMVLDAETDELVRLASLVERFGVLEEREAGLKGSFDRRKFLIESHKRLRETRPAELAAVVRRLRRYEQTLRILGVRDDHVETDYRWTRALSFALKNTLLLVLGAPFMAAGAVLNGPPYWLVRLIVLLSGPHADVRSSNGLLTAIAIFPAWYAFLAWTGWKHLDWRLWLPLLAAAPFCGIIAIRWLERWRKVGRETWALWMAVRLPDVRARLRAMRREILGAIEALAGP